jgi:hypothetical protein
MFKLAIKLAIVALIAHAGIKIVPVFWSYLRYKDALEETARFAGRKTEEQLVDRATRLATELDVKLNGAPIRVKRGNNFTQIDTRWVAQLEYFPRQYYPYEFVIHVNEGPPRYGDYIP